MFPGATGYQVGPIFFPRDRNASQRAWRHAQEQANAKRCPIRVWEWHRGIRCDLGCAVPIDSATALVLEGELADRRRAIKRNGDPYGLPC